MSHTKRIALITGAAGGLGTEMAHRLALDGHSLVLTDRGSCAELAEEIGKIGVQVSERQCDLSSDEDIERLIEWADEIGQPVDILINNAAEQTSTPLEALSVEEFRRTLQVNVTAPFMLGKTFGLRMAARGWGRIINIISGSSWMPPPGFVSYSTSKMGLVGLTRTLANELGMRGVTVNGISPALTLHKNTAGALPQEIWDMQRELQAIKRTAQPRDIAGFISFLCSDDSEFVTGQTLFANGGGLML